MSNIAEKGFINLLHENSFFLKRYPKTWKELEKLAQLYLQFQDYNTFPGEIISGARYHHQIDVKGVFTKGNHEFVTLVECKFKNKPIEKDYIGSFAEVIEDSGASKGIIISKSGYQKGAIEFVKKRPIELITLSNLMIYIRIKLVKSLFSELYTEYEVVRGKFPSEDARAHDPSLNIRIIVEAPKHRKPADL